MQSTFGVRQDAYVIINPELVRLIQKCGWQKLVSAVSHGKSAKGQRLVFKTVSRSRYCLRVDWLDNNKG